MDRGKKLRWPRYAQEFIMHKEIKSPRDLWKRTNYTPYCRKQARARSIERRKAQVLKQIDLERARAVRATDIQMKNQLRLTVKPRS